MIVPGTVAATELSQVRAFEICIKNQVLGILPLNPAPTAAFTSEGGFKPPEEYPWSTAAEEQLNERLTRLLEGRSKEE